MERIVPDVEKYGYFYASPWWLKDEEQNIVELLTSLHR